MAKPKTIQTKLRSQGVTLTDSEAEALHAGYWDMYKGVMTYIEELHRQYIANADFVPWEVERIKNFKSVKRRGSWILNGMGHPIATHGEKAKDVLNSNCQSTAARIQVMWLGLLAKNLRKAGLTWFPWLWDLYDAVYFEVLEGQAGQAAQVVRDTLAELNALLKPVLPLQGEPNMVSNWWEDKL